MSSEQQAFVNWLLTLVCVFFAGFYVGGGDWLFASVAMVGVLISMSLPEDE